jgi:hypothetical protein
MGRGAGGTKVWWARMPHVSCPRMAAHMARVREDRVGMVACRVVLWQAMVGLMGWRLVKGRRAAVLK